MTVFRAKATVRHAEADRVLDELLTHMAEHAAVIRSGTGARISSPFGTVDVERDGETIEVEITSGAPEILAMIKVFAAEHIIEFAGPETEIVWAGDAAAETVPAHFQKLVVTAALDVTPRMRRVIFACENASAYTGNAAYHARLLLPPQDREPRWPVIASDGRMRWPDGEDTLTSRVYTIRTADPVSNAIAIDFVLHEGVVSPGADFARHAGAGDVVGLLGPGGDGCPQAKDVLLLGDEAALPAIARMLENLGNDCRAEVFVEVEDEQDVQQIDSRAAVTMNWLYRRGAAPGAADMLEKALARHLASQSRGEAYIWAGCEQHVAVRLREMVRPHRAGNRNSHRILGYWNRNA